MKNWPRSSRRLFGNFGRFVFSAKKLYIAIIAVVLVEPFMSFAAPQIPVNISISGSSNKPTLSWSPVVDGQIDPAAWVEKGDTSIRWGEMGDFASTVFDGKMWVIGNNNDQTATNNIWSSADGLSWTEVSALAPWSGRYNTQMVTYDNKMWIMGGQKPNAGPPIFANDVWYSSNGTDWTQATASAGWVARTHHKVVVFNNKMWVIGGANGAGYVNDVWSSLDGVSWSKATDSVGWAGRSGDSVVAFDSKLWLFGGNNYTNNLNDVWSSADGVVWTEVTASADWSIRQKQSSVVFDNKMWIIGGANGASVLNDVWSSTNGSNWTEVSSGASWRARYNQATLVLDSKMWVIGGFSYLGSLNDVWSSTNGLAWSEVTETTSDVIWTARAGQMSTAYAGKLWVMGGNGDDGMTNDVWSSEDGLTWTKVTEQADWSARSDATLTVFDNKMWLMGGNTNDVWYSTNGINWTEATANAGWSARYGLSSTSFDGKLWIMGGSDSDTYVSLSDVWYSTNGINWTEATANAWPGREYFGKEVPVMDGKMWVIGGESDTTDSYLIGDVWSSSNGVSWTQVASSTPWGERGYHMTAVFDNKLWVIGGDYGNNGDVGSDIWYSSDGVDWTLATDSAPWGQADYMTGAILNNRLWVMGGHSATDNVNMRGVWSIKNNAIAYYKVCWGTTEGSCTYTANVNPGGTVIGMTSPTEKSGLLAQLLSVLSPTTSAQSVKLSYTIPTTLASGTWYFAVAAVTEDGDQSVLSDSTVAVVSTSNESSNNASSSASNNTVAVTDITSTTQESSNNQSPKLVKDNTQATTEDSSNQSTNSLNWLWISLATLTLILVMYFYFRPKKQQP